LLPLAPALLLCAVALHQLHLAGAHAISPWKGGGFGMFSTTDTGPQRELRVFLVSHSGARAVALPESLDDIASRAAVLPTPTRLRELARRVGEDMGGLLPDLASVRVELWRTRFDSEGLEPRAELLRRVEVEWDADGR
jgi:hypothetical protein